MKLKAGQNTIRLYNDQGDAPNVDRIALALPPDEDVLPGDLNFDGMIDARDLTLLKRYLMTEFPSRKAEKAGDMDQDGKLTAADAKDHAKYLTTQR